MKRCPCCGQPIPEGSQLVPGQKPVLTILLIKKDGVFPVYQHDIDMWQETFPAVDVEKCLKHIRQWNEDNPERRKTKKGIRPHITTWLANEQNKGGGIFKRATRPQEARVSNTTQRNMSVAEGWLNGGSGQA